MRMYELKRFMNVAKSASRAKQDKATNTVGMRREIGGARLALCTVVVVVSRTTAKKHSIP